MHYNSIKNQMMKYYENWVLDVILKEQNKAIATISEAIIFRNVQQLILWKEIAEFKYSWIYICQKKKNWSWEHRC